MKKNKFELIINHGSDFDHKFLEKKEFLRKISTLLKEPKKIFLGMGNFLELGDYNKLIDSVLFMEEGIKLEQIIDRNNRKLSQDGKIPYSFYRLGVYFPDFIFKDVPTFYISTIGKKARLAPGAENFIKYIKEYDPLILSAIPYGIAIELVKRLDLGKNNLISTDYKVKKNQDKKKTVYAGGINRFISGDRKSIEIEKHMIDNDLKDNEIVYIGSGEAGVNTFSKVKNSIAFNPKKNIIPKAKITLYGSSLESLLVLFNFDGILEKFLLSERMEGFLPSLAVFSEAKEKTDSLINIELEHRILQNNLLCQRVEYSGESYDSVANEIDVDFRGSSIGIEKIRHIIMERIKKHTANPQEIVKEIYGIAKERYKSYGTN